MEIKTCEEYVVNELINKEAELAELRDSLEVLNAKLKFIKEDFDTLIKIINPKIVKNGDNVYFNFSTVWSNFDRKNYDTLYTIFKQRGVDFDGE